MRNTKQFICFILTLALSLYFSGCGRKPASKIKVDGIQSKVQKVLTGNQIELQNGLKVEILGIKPSEHTKNYLEKQVKGETVVVVSDSKQPQYINTYMTKVRAYVKVKGEGYCVTGKMLTNRIAELSQTFVKDSIEQFKKYAYGDTPHSTMTSTELLTYMKPATFMIYSEDESLGTGFFINDNGLALTNNHVYDGSNEALIFFFDEDGNVNFSNYRKINRVLFTGQAGENNRIDFTVFQVQLDNGEKVRYMPLIKQHEKDGEAIAKIGCPLGNPKCNFQTGILSHYNEGYFTHNIPANHGDSGGPIVNFRGEVVGLNQSIDFNTTIGEQAKGIAYGVDADLIRQLLEANEIQYGR